MTRTMHLPVALARTSGDDLAPLMRIAERVPIPRGAVQRRLAERARAGDRAAREQLILGNLRLVAKISGQFTDRGLSRADLVQEGVIGLMRAIDRFEPERGLSLSTYATWWIRQAMSRAVAERGRSVHLPIRMSEDAGALTRAAAALGDDGEEALARATGLDAARIREVRRCTAPVASLDHVAREGGATLGELQADPDVDVADTALARAAARDLYRALFGINPLERAVLALSHGLDGSAPRTVAEIATLLKVTPARVARCRKAGMEHLAQQMQDATG